MDVDALSVVIEYNNNKQEASTLLNVQIKHIVGVTFKRTTTDSGGTTATI